jgi:hypothetical protein
VYCASSLERGACKHCCFVVHIYTHGWTSNLDEGEEGELNTSQNYFAPNPLMMSTSSEEGVMNAIRMPKLLQSYVSEIVSDIRKEISGHK